MNILARTHILLFIAAALPMAAVADDSAIEISPLCVATGCFSGDAPGFPVEITQPGRYRLTGNLDVSGAPSPEDVTAILIQVPNVEIDLAGHTIQGPATCTYDDPFVSCDIAEATGNGVDSGFPGTVISNGFIQGMGRNGIECRSVGTTCTIRNVEVSSNVRTGIEFQLAGGAIIDSQAYVNRTNGIETSAGAATTHSVRIVNTESKFNGGSGFDCGNASILESTAHNNAGTGAVLVRGVIRSSNLFANRTQGLSCTDCVATDNTIRQNSLFGAEFQGTTVAGGNLISGSGLNDLIGTITVESAPNLCGAGPC